MASDWIKLRVDIFRDPSVLKMSDMCRTSRHHIVGLLSDVWGWIDGHTVDGACPNVSASMINTYLGVDGFAEAMMACGWLEERNGGVNLPKWNRHNSQTAKARALENEAKRLRREGVRQVSDKTSDTCRTKRPTREEKRREEKIEREAPPPELPQSPEKCAEQAKLLGVLPNIAESYWHDRDAVGWVNRGGQPIRNWQSDLKSYATKWASNQAATAARNGSTPDAPQRRQLA